MKNIRAYLTIAVVSLMLVAASAFSLSGIAHAGAVCVPLLFGLVFCWSAVKAALAAMDSDAHRDTATAVCSFPVLSLIHIYWPCSTPVSGAARPNRPPFRS